MKKILYLIILALGVISGCKKEADPILEDPDTRLNAKLTEYETLLSSAPNGWKAQLFPTGGKGYSFYFKFNAGKVTMVSDFSTTTASTPKESTYRLKALQLPTLIFDTYSYIHLLSDPGAGVSGGTTGKGLSSDFEFAIVKVEGDKIYLGGTFNGNAIVLTKATSQEETSYLGNGFKAMVDANTLYQTNNRFPFIQFDDAVKIAVATDPTLRTITLTYLSEGVVKAASTNFAFDVNGLILKDSLSYNGKSFKQIYWDSTNKVYYIMDGSSRITFQTSSVPLIPLSNLLGFGKTYSTLTYDVDGGLPAGVVSPYNAVYNSSEALMRASSATGRRIDYTTLVFTAPNQITFNVYYFALLAGGVDGSPFVASIVYNITYDANNNISLTPVSLSGNWTSRATQLQPFRNYFEAPGRKFKIDWVNNPNATSSTLIGGLYPSDNAAAFLYGIPVK